MAGEGEGGSGEGLGDAVVGEGEQPADALGEAVGDGALALGRPHAARSRAVVSSKAARRIGDTVLDAGDIHDQTTWRSEDRDAQTWRSLHAEGPLLIAFEVLDLYRLAKIRVSRVK